MIILVVHYIGYCIIFCDINIDFQQLTAFNRKALICIMKDTKEKWARETEMQLIKHHTIDAPDRETMDLSTCRL